MSLTDITIGQHLPGSSLLHRADSRLKLILTVAYAVVLFIDSNPLGVFLAFILILTAYSAAAIPFKLILKSLKPILPIILFTLVLNGFFIQGDPIFTLFNTITLSRQGLLFAILMACRIGLLIIGSSLLTYTTSPILLTAAIESVLSPLKVIKLPVHELAMMMTIALRFIPTLLEETEKIVTAQRARGARFDEGSIAQRVKAMIPILIPLFVSAFRRADELAMAMECRCYNGGDGRTRLHRMQFTGRDVILAVCALCYFVLIAFSGMIYDYIISLI